MSNAMANIVICSFIGLKNGKRLLKKYNDLATNLDGQNPNNYEIDAIAN